MGAAVRLQHVHVDTYCVAAMIYDSVYHIGSILINENEEQAVSI